MLISTDVLLSMRCPECGRLEYHSLSRFAFSSSKLVKIKCACGYVKVTINAKKRCNYYWMQLPCIICETKHLVRVPVAEVWSKDVTTIYCDETGMELACIGSAEKIKGSSNAREEIEALVGNFWGDDYFNNSQVMYDILHHLHDVAEKGMLYCRCGNRQISVDVFPDRLELFCDNCETINTIFTKSNKDLEIISHVERIELTQNRLRCIDSLAGRAKTSRGCKGPEN